MQKQNKPNEDKNYGNIIENLIDSEEPASTFFFPVSHVGPFIPLVMHCLQDSLQIPFRLHTAGVVFLARS